MKRTILPLTIGALTIVGVARVVVRSFKLLDPVPDSLTIPLIYEQRPSLQSPFLETSPSELSYIASVVAIPNNSTMKRKRRLKFYILKIPELTTWLLGNYTEHAQRFYRDTLNEQQAEVWLHRGFQQLRGSLTENPLMANVILIPAYLHFNQHLLRLKSKQKSKHNTPTAQNLTTLPLPNEKWVKLILERIRYKAVPHVLMVPTWNPEVSGKIGIKLLVQQLKRYRVNLYSLGFERNTFWQQVETSRIVTIPYVVIPNQTRQALADVYSSRRKENFIFYAGDRRGLALQVAGCNRSVVLPLSNRTDMDVRIVTKDNRLTQEEYNHRMETSDYCLLLCGDTATSRSLASSMLYGCLPIRVGSRLRGFCEPPCWARWGWNVANQSHLPFPNRIDWSLFPEINEYEFSQTPLRVLQQLLASITKERKDQLRGIMKENQMSWIYGWGDPTTSTDFGDAISYVWASLEDELFPA